MCNVQAPSGAKGIGARSSVLSHAPGIFLSGSRERGIPTDTVLVGRILRRRGTEGRMMLLIDDPFPPEDRTGLKMARTDFAALYRSESGRLARYFSRRVAPHEVIDMVHETFRKLLGAANDRDVRFDNPEAYLTRVADNLVRDRARSLAQRASERSEPFDETQLGGPDPHQQLEHRDTLKRIETALTTLKPKTREIFLMHRSDGLSYAEIADAMGMSVKGVEKQMTKALTHLRRRLDRA
jgi:RNA polymerase sigma factor (sigma-70 family)